jgi:predicted phosphodiesterase/recombinational DNA repair ATPase RecF
LFGDTHFQEKGLDKIRTTGRWISEEFKKKKVDIIICLGDVLNTRDFVNVEAQSAAFDMFRRLAQENPSAPIHIVLGNHDMNLKHSRRISSLDGLRIGEPLDSDEAESKSSIQLHTEITHKIIKGVPCLFVPYHQEPEDIIQYIETMKQESKKKGQKLNMKDIVVFGHLSVHGATQNDGRRFAGAIHSSLFSPFKRTFSGHYHYHHTLDNRVVYVGSPMQFNFGDAGHNRGVVVYDSATDKMRHIVNTFSPRFYKMTEQEVEKNLKEENVAIFKDAHVMIEFAQPKPFSVFQELRERLVQLQCADVRRFHELEKVIKDPQTQTHVPTEYDIPMILEQYVKSVDKLLKVGDKEQKSVQQLFENEEKLKLLLAEGLEILKRVNDRTLASNSGLSHIFDGDLACINIDGFMSFYDPVEIRVKDMSDGIWIIEGDNGSGKSSIFEAIVWCHFGVFLRSELSKDQGINNDCKRAIVRIEYTNGFAIERERKVGKSDELRTFQRNEKGVLEPLDQNEKGATKNSQKKLNDHIGIEYKVFSKSVLLGQNIVNNFISGSREERRLIIEEMLGLEKLVFYSEEAKGKLKELDASISALSNESNKNEENIAKLQEKIKNRIEEKKRQESELILAEERYDSALKNKEAKIDKVQEDKKTLEKKKIETEELIARIMIRLAEVQKEESLSPPQEKKLIQLNTAIEQQLRTLKTNAKKIKESHVSDEEANCPLCGQPIESECQTKIEVDYLSELKVILKNPELSSYNLGDGDINVAITLCSTIIADLDAKIKLNQERVDRVERGKNKEKEEKEKLRLVEQRLAQVEKQYSSIDKEESNLLHDIDKKKELVESGIKMHTQQIEEWEKEKEMIEQEEAQIQEKKIEKEARYEISKFWDLAFDSKNKKNSGIVNLRSFIFEESISELNLLLQEYMEQFSSGLNRELTSTLTNDLELEENYGRRSGGERKRTDLAVLFSLFELVRSRSRYLPRFIMLDEVFDSLDKNGKAAVRTILIRLSQKLKKIFIIAHSDIATGISIAGTVNVEMQMFDGKPRTAVHIKQSSS